MALATESGYASLGIVKKEGNSIKEGITEKTYWHARLDSDPRITLAFTSSFQNTYSSSAAMEPKNTLPTLIGYFSYFSAFPRRKSPIYISNQCQTLIGYSSASEA